MLVGLKVICSRGLIVVIIAVLLDGLMMDGFGDGSLWPSSKSSIAKEGWV